MNTRDNSNTVLGDGIQPIPAQASNAQRQQQKQIKPSVETAERIKNLAEVGTALHHSSDDISFQTKFFAAKESLNRFKTGIDRLDLDPQSKQGMEDLVAYLTKKIDRRLNSSENDAAIPTV